MKYSTRLSDAVHILLFIHLDPSGSLSSAAIAESICTNPSYVRQLMSALRRGGLLSSARGQAAPALCRALEAVTLLDVYRAVEGEKPLLHLDTHTNPDCGVGVNIQLALSDAYDLVQQAAEERMARLTLAGLLADYERYIRSAQKTGGDPSEKEG